MIQGNAPPSAAFTYSINIDTVRFSLIGSVDSVQWDFGDNQQSNSFNPVHVYAQEGYYLVALTVYNVCGSDTYTAGVQIIFPPVADFIATPLEGCAPMEVLFSEKVSANSIHFEWSFPSGTPSFASLPNPTITYYSAGTYTVRLIVHNAVGSDTIERLHYINSFHLPVAAFSYQIGDSSNVLFVNQSIDALSVHWDFGDGQFSDSIHPVHIYQNGGMHQVILTVYNPCGEDSVTMFVEINHLPEATFSVDTVIGCTPFQVQFMDHSQPGIISWSWNFEGGTPATSTEHYPIVSYFQPGKFDVTLEVTNAAGDALISKVEYIHVESAPQASFISVTFLQKVKFTNTSLYGQSFTWYFGDGQFSNEENSTHEFETGGEYDVILIVNNNCGTDTVIITLQIQPLPVVSVSRSGTISIFLIRRLFL